MRRRAECALEHPRQAEPVDAGDHLGRQIALEDARIDASGDAGGGTILGHDIRALPPEARARICPRAKRPPSRIAACRCQTG
jgi:hypothetical protein